MPVCHRILPHRSIVNAVRRRLWLRIFASHQAHLGSFFLDPRDHIGSERIIMGDLYEGATLEVLGAVIERLGLGKGSVLDVGANIGNHACWFASRFSHVVCVEPGKVASLILEANLAASDAHNVTLHRCALGDREAIGHLERVSATNLGSSVVTEVDEIEEGEFRIVRGDDLWATSSPDAPLELVKIDVEGAEASVIRGLTGVLSRYQPIVCVEVLDESRWHTVRALLESAGYASWYVIDADINPGASVLARVRSACRGRTYRMVPLPSPFGSRGYDMILCMTRSHAMKMRA